MVVLSECEGIGDNGFEGSPRHRLLREPWTVDRLPPFKNQEQQIIPTVDLNFGPKWEFNFGVGIGITVPLNTLWLS